jgi:Ca2+-binding EF-hand superfamily protein
MGQIEAVNYLRQASGAYVMSYDRRIREMFEDFDKDNDGILTVVDFLNYNLKSITTYTYEKYYK